MLWPSLRTQPGHVVKIRTCPSREQCSITGPPILRGPPTSQAPRPDSPGMTIYEGEARGGYGAGKWVNLPLETQKDEGRRLDQMLEVPG